MIGQLVRTKFESNLMSFSVFMGLIVVVGIRYLITREVPQGPVPREAIVMAAATLMLCCLAAGIISLLRQTRERGNRLYAQLPVSARQIRVAYWLHVSLYPGIATMLFLAFVLFAGTEPAPVEYQFMTVGLFFSMCLWLACLALVTSNIARVIPETVRKNTVLYCVVVTMATLMLGYALMLAMAALIGASEGPADWPKAIIGMAIVCTALVMLDIYLFGKKDRNLD
jgi:hypothetical protein